MMTQTKTESVVNIIEDIKNISKVTSEPKCITDHRLSMWETYINLESPSRVDHLWRYSEPKIFELNNYLISPSNVKLDLKIEHAHLGLIFAPIGEIFKIESLREVIKSKFGELTNKNPGKITFLNEATWSCGYFLFVPKGTVITKPLSVKFNISKSGHLHSIRSLIILEEASSISLIEETSSSSPCDAIINSATEIFLSENSKLNYLNFQTLDKTTIRHNLQRAFINQHAKLNNLIVALGGKTTKADLGFILGGNNAFITTHGIVLGDSNQKFDHHTTIEHTAPNTKSELNFRVVLKDNAKSAYTGNLKITNEAIKSDAYQENRNLLLSPDAKAESIPELEILTNDVSRCSHGVTVGQVDKEQIYYLMSRGIEQKEAEKIIINGFLEPTISRIPDEKLQEEVKKRVEEKLEN